MPTQRNVIVLTTAYDPFIGGAELAAREVMRRMPDVQFSVLTARMRRSLPAYEVQKNIIIRRFGVGSVIDKYLLPLLAYRTAKHLSGPGTVLWCIMVSYASIGGYYLKRKNPQLRLVLTLQEGDVIEGRKFGVVASWWKRLLSAADEVHAISRYLADLAVHFGYKKNVHVIPNGVDSALFSRRDEERIAEIRKKYALERFSFILVSVSRLVEKNGLADVIRALPHLEGVGFLIVGDGSLHTQLTSLAGKLGVSDRVLFAGSVPLEEVPSYLHASHAFIRLSKSEGLGTAFLEAMAAGIPIIATPVGGIVDFLEDQQTGISVANGETSAVVRAIRSLKQEELRNAVSERGIALIRSRYTWDQVTKEFRALIDHTHA